MTGLMAFRPVTHHGACLGVLRVDRAVLVVGTVAVIASRMLQANSVTDFMNSRDRKVTAQRRRSRPARVPIVAAVRFVEP